MNLPAFANGALQTQVSTELSTIDIVIYDDIRGRDAGFDPRLLASRCRPTPGFNDKEADKAVLFSGDRLIRPFGQTVKLAFCRR